MSSTKKALAFISTSALAAGAAHGAILYTPINVTISGNSALALDLNQDGIPDFLIQFNANAAAKPYITNAPAGSTSSFVLSASSGNGLPVTVSGTAINGSYQSAQAVGYFNQNAGTTTEGGWTAAGNNEGYVGLELVDGAGTHFGWAHFIYNSAAVPANDVDKGTLTLVDAAMESAPSVTITAGQTAEASTGPAVDLPPVSQTGYLGGTVQFTVNATGNPAPTFQWQSGAVGSGLYSNISSGVVTTDGANSTLTLYNLTMANMLDYVVVVSNPSGPVTTAPATLTVASASDSPATLVHRYSFQDTAGSGSFADSVGGPEWAGTPYGDATLTGSSLSLDGTSGTYAVLPSDITSDYTQITVEFWADIGTQTAPWARVFAFGNINGTEKQSGVDYSPNAAPGNYQNLDVLNNSGVDAYANVEAPITNTTGNHITVVADSVNGAFYFYNGTNLISQLHDNNNATIAGAVLATAPGVDMSWAVMDDVYNTIGASLVAADPYLVGTIYEFRIYQGVLSPQAVALNDAVGPATYIEVSANPTLSASINAGNLLLTWPVSDVDFVVQSKSVAANGTSWTTLTNVPTLVGSNWQVSIPTNGAAQFYQLKFK